MRWAPIAAGLVAVGVGALLVLAADETPRAPEPDPPPTTAPPRESPQLRWFVTGDRPQHFDGSGRPSGFVLDAIHDLDRDATVARLRSTEGGGRVSLLDSTDVSGRVGETVRFSVWVRTSGSVEAALFLAVPELTMENGGRPTSQLVEVTSHRVPAGSDWVQREVSLVVPPRANLLVFGIRFDGDGALAVDDVVGP